MIWDFMNPHKISANLDHKQKSFIPKKNMKCTMHHGQFFLQPKDAVLSLNSPSISGSEKLILHIVMDLSSEGFVIFHIFATPQKYNQKQGILSQ